MNIKDHPSIHVTTFTREECYIRSVIHYDWRGDKAVMLAETAQLPKQRACLFDARVSYSGTCSGFKRFSSIINAIHSWIAQGVLTWPDGVE